MNRVGPGGGLGGGGVVGVLLLYLLGLLVAPPAVTGLRLERRLDRVGWLGSERAVADLAWLRSVALPRGGVLQLGL